jgi:hypothetical protein
MAVALSACGSHETARPADREAEKREAIERSVHRIDAPPAALPHHEYTRLLDAGREPRAVLRYALAARTVEYRAPSTLRTRSFANQTWSAWRDLPVITDGFAVTADADAHRPLVVRPLVAEVAGPDAWSAQYVATWRKLEGRRLAVAFDDRGQLGPVGFGDDPATSQGGSARDDVTQRLLAMTVQLPEEPIGIGGSWRVVDVLRQPPAIVKQTATYTLVERTPTTARLTVELVRNAQLQTVTDPGLPAGTDAELEALNRKLTGAIDLDLAQPLLAGTLELESRMHVKLVPPTGVAEEQLLEDAGKIAVAAH